MATPPPDDDENFSAYGWSTPPRIVVCCAPGFRSAVRAVFATCSAAERKDFANINALIERFAAGEQLSQSSFPIEPPGFAFKAGSIRFYGNYSTRHKGHFVLSHAVVKRHQKLRQVDKDRMKNCAEAFDRLELPPIPTDR